MSEQGILVITLVVLMGLLISGKWRYDAVTLVCLAALVDRDRYHLENIVKATWLIENRFQPVVGVCVYLCRCVRTCACVHVPACERQIPSKTSIGPFSAAALKTRDVEAVKALPLDGWASY